LYGFIDNNITNSTTTGTIIKAFWAEGESPLGEVALKAGTSGKVPERGEVDGYCSNAGVSLVIASE
jgi:hypothetical protein